METKTNELDYNIFKRQEEKSGKNIIKHGVETIDFMIDGNSLLEKLTENDGNNDFIGCFSKGWNKLNEKSKNQLLVKTKPETKNGRVLIYVCPECGDISCGALCCKIKKGNGLYIWNDFAYENDYEEEIINKNIGIFYFKEKKYEEMIIKLFSIME
jgi:hypothetical protein